MRIVLVFIGIILTYEIRSQVNSLNVEDFFLFDEIGIDRLSILSQSKLKKDINVVDTSNLKNGILGIATSDYPVTFIKRFSYCLQTKKDIKQIPIKNLLFPLPINFKNDECINDLGSPLFFYTNNYSIHSPMVISFFIDSLRFNKTLLYVLGNDKIENNDELGLNKSNYFNKEIATYLSREYNLGFVFKGLNVNELSFKLFKKSEETPYTNLIETNFEMNNASTKGGNFIIFHKPKLWTIDDGFYEIMSDFSKIPLKSKDLYNKLLKNSTLKIKSIIRTQDTLGIAKFKDANNIFTNELNLIFRNKKHIDIKFDINNKIHFANILYNSMNSFNSRCFKKYLEKNESAQIVYEPYFRTSFTSSILSYYSAQKNFKYGDTIIIRNNDFDFLKNFVLIDSLKTKQRFSIEESKMDRVNENIIAKTKFSYSPDGKIEEIKNFQGVYFQFNKERELIVKQNIHTYRYFYVNDSEMVRVKLRDMSILNDSDESCRLYKSKSDEDKNSSADTSLMDLDKLNLNEIEIQIKENDIKQNLSNLKPYKATLPDFYTSDYSFNKTYQYKIMEGDENSMYDLLLEYYKEKLYIIKELIKLKPRGILSDEILELQLVRKLNDQSFTIYNYIIKKELISMNVNTILEYGSRIPTTSPIYDINWKTNIITK